MVFLSFVSLELIDFLTNYFNLLQPPLFTTGSKEMAPQSSRPTTIDHFFSNYQYPILMSAFATQVCHYQYIRRAEPAIESSSIRAASFPRPLRAGLGWAVVFVGLLTRITIAKIVIRDYSDPTLNQLPLRNAWRKVPEQGI